MKFSDLMTLAEASTGFSGGTIVDEMPHMSLSECAGELPVAMMREQISLQETVSQINDSMVEATINAIQTGSFDEYNVIAENAFETLKNKIVAVFEKIKKFLSSIIAKLGVQINKFRMTGKQMLSRYQNSDMLKKDFSDFTVEGFKFNAKDVFADTNMKPVDLIQKAMPNRVQAPSDFAKTALASLDKTNVKTMENKLNAMTEITSKDRKQAYAQALIPGVKLSADEWTSDIQKGLYGEKLTLKYGKDFDKKSIEAALVGADLEQIEQAYKTLKGEVEKDQGEIQRAADEFKDTAPDKFYKNSKGKPIEDRADKPEPVSIGVANKYFSAYLAYYQDCVAVISQIQNIRLNFEKAKINQAKSVYAKMLTYKGKKSDNNDASDIDEIDVLSMDV